MDHNNHSNKISWIAELTTGYTKEWFLPSDQLDILTCAICLNIAKSPANLETCPHIFCRTCITTYWRHKAINEKTCPCCRKIQMQMGPLQTNGFVESIIQRLHIQCPSKPVIKDDGEGDENHSSSILLPSDECKWISTMGTDHRNIEDHFIKCPHSFTLCPSSCGSKVFKKDLKYHLTHQCIFRRVVCNSCKNDMTYQQFYSSQHASLQSNLNPKQICKITRKENMVFAKAIATELPPSPKLAPVVSCFSSSSSSSSSSYAPRPQISELHLFQLKHEDESPSCPSEISSSSLDMVWTKSSLNRFRDLLRVGHQADVFLDSKWQTLTIHKVHRKPHRNHTQNDQSIHLYFMTPSTRIHCEPRFSINVYPPGTKVK